MQAPVSVIIPCYNCSETIEKAVDSIAKQTLIPKEVILVNDNSPDQTIEILSLWIKHFELTFNIERGSSGSCISIAPGSLSQAHEIIIYQHLCGVK